MHVRRMFMQHGDLDCIFLMLVKHSSNIFDLHIEMFNQTIGTMNQELFEKKLWRLSKR